jgi:hypothetical protein
VCGTGTVAATDVVNGTDVVAEDEAGEMVNGTAEVAAAVSADAANGTRTLGSSVTFTPVKGEPWRLFSSPRPSRIVDPVVRRVIATVATAAVIQDDILESSDAED